MNNLESIAKDLCEEYSRLTEERNAVEARLHQMDAELKRVEVALAALGEKPKREKSKSGKPAPKKDEVETAVKQILAEQGSSSKQPEPNPSLEELFGKSLGVDVFEAARLKQEENL